MGRMTGLPGSVAGDVVFSSTYPHGSNQSTAGYPIHPTSAGIVASSTCDPLAGFGGVWGVSYVLRWRGNGEVEGKITTLRGLFASVAATGV